MRGLAFGCFFGFALLTVLIAFAGGFFALTRWGGDAQAIGFLLFFLGASLALMLGSLLLIRVKEKRQIKSQSK